MTTSRSSIPTLNINRFLNAVTFGAQEQYPDEWKEFCKIEKTNRPFVEDVKLVGTGAAATKGENSSIQYDSIKEAYVSKGIITTVAHGFSVTEEAFEDDLWLKLSTNMAKMQMKSMKHTKNVRGANLLNNGFDSSFTNGDGQPLFSTAHPLAGTGGTFSNRLSTGASLSYESVKSMSILAGSMVDERGLPEPVRLKKLVVGVALETDAEIILNSLLRPGTGDNDINAVRTLGLLPQGACVNHYLTSETAYYAITDCEHGLKHVIRKAPVTEMDGDFDTGNIRQKIRERYTFYWHDARGAVASAGA